MATTAPADQPAARLRLRALRPGDGEAFAAAHRAMAAVDGFPFGLGYRPSMAWDDYRSRLAAWERGEQLPEGWVRSVFLVADVEGVLVGRTSVRFELNDFLLREGGHVGYCVLPAYRRRGYATEILRQSLARLREAGVDRALVTCDEGNVASAATIERCGGVLESIVPVAGAPAKRRYWIGLTS